METGEQSIFQRELGSRSEYFGEIKRKVLRPGTNFDEQDFCQVCGFGGTLMWCPFCPICVHKEYAGVTDLKYVLSCPHHRCSKCFNNAQAVDGILFFLQELPPKLCEDLFPEIEKGFRCIGTCPRFHKLGYRGKNFSYIHCLAKCEIYANVQFRKSPPSKVRASTSAALDLSHEFGSKIDSNVNISESEVVQRCFRKRKKTSYSEEKIDIILEVPKTPRQFNFKSQQPVVVRSSST